MSSQPGSPALDITTSISWISHQIERFANNQLAQLDLPTGMSVARANLMLAIHAAHAGQTTARMVDIALDVGVTARTLTTMVDALEKQGLLTRIPDPDDRRAIQLALTEDGNAAIPPLRDALGSASDAIVSPLLPDERETFLRLLYKLMDDAS